MSEIVLLRHSFAEDAVGGDDQNRPLSQKGIDLAKARRIELGNPDFDLVISSTALRAIQTAMIIAGREPDEKYGVLYDPLVRVPETEKEEFPGETDPLQFSSVRLEIIKIRNSMYTEKDGEFVYKKVLVVVHTETLELVYKHIKGSSECCGISYDPKDYENPREIP